MTELERVIRKVKKLLAMASDVSSPNEAAIAARRARSLMDQHQLSQEDLLIDTDDRFGVSASEKTYKQLPTWARFLAQAAGQLNDCEVVIHREWNPKKVKFEFRGFATDADLSAHTHAYLVDVCNSLLKRSSVSGRSGVNFYRVGFAEQILSRVYQITSERETIKTAAGQALVACKKGMVESHFERLPSAANANYRNPDESEICAYHKGVNDARSVQLRTEIDGKRQARLGAS